MLFQNRFPMLGITVIDKLLLNIKPGMVTVHGDGEIMFFAIVINLHHFITIYLVTQWWIEFYADKSFVFDSIFHQWKMVGPLGVHRKKWKDSSGALQIGLHQIIPLIVKPLFIPVRFSITANIHHQPDKCIIHLKVIEQMVGDCRGAWFQGYPKRFINIKQVRFGVVIRISPGRQGIQNLFQCCPAQMLRIDIDSIESWNILEIVFREILKNIGTQNGPDKLLQELIFCKVSWFFRQIIDKILDSLHEILGDIFMPQTVSNGADSFAGEYIPKGKQMCMCVDMHNIRILSGLYRYNRISGIWQNDFLSNQLEDWFPVFK